MKLILILIIKRYILVILLVTTGTHGLFAQKFEPIQDSTEIQYFYDYTNDILNLERDSIIPLFLPYKYRIAYKTSCPYSETIFVGDSMSYDIVYSSGGKSLTANHFQTIDTIESFPFTYRNHGLGFYICGEEPKTSKDSTLFSISVDSTSISENFITSPVFLIDFGRYNGFKAMSFEKQKYIILERSGISSIGSQTSYGGTETYFLELIE